MVSKPVAQITEKRVRWTMPAHFYPLSVFRFFFVAIVLGFIVESVQAKTYYANRYIRSCVCDGDFDSSKDYFPNKVHPDYSTLWNVSYHKSYKIAKVYNSDSSVVYPSFYLYLCGTPKPEIPDGAVAIEIPIRTASFSSTTNMHMLEMIGQRTSLQYYQYGENYVTNPCFQKMFEENLILDSADGDLSSITSDVDFVGSGDYTKATKVSKNKVVPLMANDKSSLGQFEWAEFMSLFFNRELAAKNLAQNVESRMECHSDMVKNQPRKKILHIGTYPKTGSSCASMEDFLKAKFNVRACDSSPNWECESIEKAGGVTLDLQTEGGYANMSDILEQAKDADVMVMQTDSTWMSDCKDLLFNATKTFPFMKSNSVYDIAKTLSDGGGMDYFESARAEPDLIMLDYLSIFYPDHMPNYKRRYLRKVLPTLEASIVLGPENCTDYNAPYFRNWEAESCADHGVKDSIEGMDPVNNNDQCLEGSPSSAWVLQSSLWAVFAAAFLTLVL